MYTHGVRSWLLLCVSVGASGVCNGGIACEIARDCSATVTIEKFVKACAQTTRLDCSDDCKAILQEVNFNKLKPLLTNELNRMVSLYGEELFSDEVLNNFSKINSTMDGRLVLNWSESKAAFKIRFVSPDKRFFDWNSSKSLTKLNRF